VKRSMIFSGLAAGALAIGGLAAIVPGATAMPAQHSQSARHTIHACSTAAKPGFAQCHAVTMSAANGKAVVRQSPNAQPFAAGFTPTDVQAAYNLTGLSASGRTVAIVDAYGYPTLESDLATYRSTYGLPPCTTANGCFKRMDQNGGSSNPPTDQGWDIEQALDVDAVSAACPDCKILVVQANSNSYADLGAAVNRAATQPGVSAISNSYGGCCGVHDMAAYNHPNIAVVASTGDNGYDTGQYPAIDDHVVAVGGTSVTRDGSARGYHETAWSGAGSGCGVNPKPAWQDRVNTTCSTKAVGDVSAAADPSLGGLVIYCGSACGGWAQYGGTSEASPIIGAVYTLSGKTTGYPAKLAYNKKKAKKFLYDVTSGSNGGCGVPVCTARAGWDGPTGMGTPKGVKAF
jgi:subtilase family serine protease